MNKLLLAFVACLLALNLQASTLHAQAATTAATAPAATTVSTQPATAAAKLPKVAAIRLSGTVLEGPPQFSLFGDQSGKNKTLREWLNRLAKARQDDSIAAVALDMDDVRLGWAQAQELAQAVRKLDEVKPVYAFLTSGNVPTYLVAAAAREVTMDPAGHLDVKGIAGEMMFFRGTLDYLGVEPQMLQVGKYKGAAEPVMLKGPTKELREEYDRLFDDLFSQMVTQIADARRLKPDAVKAAIDEGPFAADDAMKHKLVDKLVARVNWKNHVGIKVAVRDQYLWQSDYGAPSRSGLDLSNPFSMLGSLLKKPASEIKDPTVAIVVVDGMIVTGESDVGVLGGRTVGDRTIVKALKEVGDDKRIKAVVLRIDSPGGSAIASEMIYQAVAELAAKKPVIVSVANMAASGGYYVAVGAKTVYADSTAIVGSIGVVGGKLAIDKTLNKIGITTYEITRGKNAGLELSRPWNQRELAVITRMLLKTYDLFLQRVKAGRGNRIKDIDSVAQGRVFTARQAVDNGLIDKVGTLADSVDAARKAAGIKTSAIIVLPRAKTLADILLGTDDDASVSGMGTNIDLRLLRQLGLDRPGVSYLLNLARMIGSEKTLTVMPHYVEVK